MPELRLNIPHQLPVEAAVARLQDYIARNSQRGEVRNLTQSWAGNRYQCSFTSLGMAVSADLQVLPDTVLVAVEMPLAAVPFRGLVEREIRSHLTAILAATPAD